MASKLPGAIFRRRAHPGFEIRDRAALGHRAGLSPGSRAESGSIDGAVDPIAPATLQQEDELARSGWEGKSSWSGRRDSNPRPRPWQGRALPLSYTRILWRRLRADDRQSYAKCGSRMQQRVCARSADCSELTAVSEKTVKAVKIAKNAG